MLNRKILIPALILIIVILVFVLFNYSANKTEEDAAYRNAFLKNYKVFALEIPDSINKN